MIIELDGDQHFEYIERFKNDPVNQQERDVYKMKCAISQGISILRILQMDVYNDNYDWKTELQLELYIHENPTVIYLCKNNEYKSHKLLMCEN